MPLASIPGAQRERAIAKLLPQNGLLAALSEDSRTRLLPHLALADLPAGHQLSEPGGRCARAFFPLAGVVSLVDGAGRVAAVVGSEGVVGLPRFISEAALMRPVVQCAGYGLALGREQLLQEWSLGGAFMRLLMRFSRATALQTIGLAGCRAAGHPLQQRLCSLLAMSLDRLPGNELMLSQDAAAQLLGAAPQEVAAAVDCLRDAGAAAWLRPGVFAVHQHASLRLLSCNCAGQAVRKRRQQARMAAPTQGPVRAPVPQADVSPRPARREVVAASTSAGAAVGVEHPGANLARLGEAP